MISTSNRLPANRKTVSPSLYRITVILSASVILISRYHILASADPTTSLLLFALILLSRSVPVAIASERPITFTAALVFAAALLISGEMAACIALLACTLHGALSKRTERLQAAFIGAQYSIAAHAAFATYATITATRMNDPANSSSQLTGACVGALAFVATNAALVGIEALGSGRARRADSERVLQAQALAYAASFPFAILMVFAYREFAQASLPPLAALILVCAHAVRMTVDNRRLRRQIESLNELGNTSTSGVRDEMPLRRFLVLARGLVTFQSATLWLEDDSEIGISARAVYPESGHRPDAHEAGPGSLIARTIRRTTPLIVADASRDPRQQSLVEPASWMLIPMMLHGRAIGVAQFVRGQSMPFTQTDATQLAVLIPQATIAMESTRVRHMMHRYADMATSDGLTGLLNHRRCQEILRDELSRAMRYGRPLSIMMLDVDFFKQFNDSFGHPQGDKVLQAIARIVRSTVRAVDHVGRYGGEEFITILPETGPADAFVLAERIRSGVEAEAFSTGAGGWVQKTVSVGVASFPEDADSADELVLYADNALYEAKRTGKNRVLMAAR